jgi:hypothetical protein
MTHNLFFTAADIFSLETVEVPGYALCVPGDSLVSLSRDISRSLIKALARWVLSRLDRETQRRGQHKSRCDGPYQDKGGAEKRRESGKPTYLHAFRGKALSK